MTIAISAQQLNVALDKKPVLQDIQFSFKEPQIIGLLGANGSGKSTLLRAMAGLHTYSGSLKLNDQELSKLAPKESALQISWLPQTFAVPFGYSARDIAIMGRYPTHQGAPRKSDLMKAESTLATLRVEHLIHTPVTQMSQGQLQKVNIARTLCSDSKILLLDEPSAHLDLSSSLNLLKTLRKETQSGRLIFISLHDAQLAAHHCDHIIGLKNGLCIHNDSSQGMNWRDLFWDLFGVKVSQHKIDNQRAFIPEDLDDR